MGTLGLLPNIGPTELIVVLVLGLLLFGRRLPEVGRNLGKSIIEFKRGIRDVEREIDAESRSAMLESRRSPGLEPPTSGGADARVGRADAVEPVRPEPPPAAT